jgi:GTP-binding protein
VAISAQTGQRVGRVLDAALEVAAGRRRRVPTGELNRVLGDAAFRQPAPPVKGHRPRFYYATQAAIEPPTFVLFARDANSVHFSYKRYLENRLREAFGFGGTPMRLIFRERSQVELEPRRRSPARSAKTSRAARPGATRRPARSTKTPKK